MQLLRAINVLTLASLLILTGCFGLVDDTITPADGTDTTTTVVTNNEPSSTVYGFDEMVENVIYDSTTGDEIITSVTLSVYSAAVDPDGDIITCGWDIGLDGIVDNPTVCTEAFTNLTIPIEDWIQIPSSSYNINSIAFIVTDEHGAANADILDLYYRGEEVDDGPSLMLYAFGAEDATGSVTDGIDDNLIRVTMMQGSELNWASVSVRISIDGGAPITCSNPGDSTGVCELVEYGNTGDQYWSVGDGVTIIESGQDLCTSGSCQIEVTITNTQTEETLGVLYAIAE